MATHSNTLPMFDPALVKPALAEALRKLDPRTQWKNPVMFVVYIGGILTTALWLQALAGYGAAPAGFVFAIAILLWFTVLFANFAEGLAESRSKAQAASLRGMKRAMEAKKLRKSNDYSQWDTVDVDALKRNDLVLVETGDLIPLDGEVIEGAATVDESAITGESAPVIRESGGDSSSVTGGTRLLSDWLVVRITAKSGESFLDQMVAMVEGAERQKTPNEIALAILLAGLSLIFMLVVVTLWAFSRFKGVDGGIVGTISITALVALLVCLIPTTIGALLSAIGVAGMSRMMQANVIATSGRAVEAAGDVDILLLDKTGTITLGNRQATDFIPVAGVDEQKLAEAAQLASLADDTPEGRSVVTLATDRFEMQAADLETLGAAAVPFSAETRMSGLDLPAGETADQPARQLRKGASSAVRAHVEGLGGTFPHEVDSAVDTIARRGGTPLVVADNARVLGVLELKDIIKDGIKERFAELRRMGIKTVMITGATRSRPRPSPPRPAPTTIWRRSLRRPSST